MLLREAFPYSMPAFRAEVDSFLRGFADEALFLEV
jgi:hypothetical protein